MSGKRSTASPGPRRAAQLLPPLQKADAGPSERSLDDSAASTGPFPLLRLIIAIMCRIALVCNNTDGRKAPANAECSFHDAEFPNFTARQAAPVRTSMWITTIEDRRDERRQPGSQTQERLQKSLILWDLAMIEGSATSLAFAPDVRAGLDVRKGSPPGGVARTSVAPPTADEVEHNQPLRFRAGKRPMHRSNSSSLDH